MFHKLFEAMRFGTSVPVSGDIDRYVETEHRNESQDRRDAIKRELLAEARRPRFMR